MKYLSILYTAGATQQQIDAASRKLNIPAEEMLSLVNNADPTNEKKFEVWILRQLTRQQIQLPEETKIVHSLLKDFILFSNKKQLSKSDINSYTVEELKNEISKIKDSSLQDSYSHEVNEALQLPGVEVFTQNSAYLILKVSNEKSLCALSDSTEWCTRHQESAHRYLVSLKYDFLYVIFKKENNTLVKYAQATPDFSEVQNIRNLALKKHEMYHISSSFQDALDTETDITKKMTMFANLKNDIATMNFFREIENMPRNSGYSSRVVVNDGVNLNDSKISFLPKNIFIQGTLQIQNCDLLEEIPETLYCEGLDATGCSNLKNLPSFKESLSQEFGIVKRNLFISGCTSLSTFPAIKKINGTLHATQAVTLKNLGVLEELEGNCNLQYSGIEVLPETFKCDVLDLRNTTIKQLPKKLTASFVDLSDCETVIKFSPGSEWYVKNELDLSSCVFLRNLPEKLSVSHLNIDNTPIRKLPTGLTILPEDEERLVLLDHGITGVNPLTYRPYQEEYNEMQKQKDSQLANDRPPRYDFPDEDEFGLPDFKTYMAEINFVVKSRKQLLKQKLKDNKAVQTPTDKNGLYHIVSREPTNNRKWRVTTFIHGEPWSHSVCDTLTSGNTSVYESLIGINWEEWAEQEYL